MLPQTTSEQRPIAAILPEYVRQIDLFPCTKHGPRSRYQHANFLSRAGSFTEHLVCRCCPEIFREVFSAVGSGILTGSAAILPLKLLERMNQVKSSISKGPLNIVRAPQTGSYTLRCLRRGCAAFLYSRCIGMISAHEYLSMN
jgi:hypothetical protein